MKSVLAVLAVAVSILGVADAIATALPPAAASLVFPIVSPIVVIGTGLSVMALKRAREKRDRSAAPEGVERGLATVAQSKVMIDGIIVALALAVILLFVKPASASVALYLLVIFVLVDFWVRYTVLLRRARHEH
ncbi:MAG: hypothetical protein ABI400_11970 [Lacisediminihabitans sp.]